MPNDGDDKMKAASSALADQANQNAQRGVQAMQDIGRAAQETGQKSAQQFTQAAQDMSKRTSEASMAGMAEFGRMFSEMRFPGMPDMDAFLAAHRRNMETLSAANRVALEGAQSVAKRHMEIVQQTMQDMSETIRDLSSPDNPQARAAKQADLVKNAYERAVSHMRDLAELIQRSNGEALQMLNQRFTEAMDEVKALAEKAGERSA